MSGFCFIDGVFAEEENAVLNLSNALHAGEGFFETFRTWQGKVFRWHRHAARLFSSASEASLKLSMSPSQVESAVRRLVAMNNVPDARVRITVFPLARGGSSSVAIQATQLQQHEGASRPVRIAFAGPGSAPPLPGVRHKSASRLRFTLARCEAEKAGAEEALLQNFAGAVTEATIANVFFVIAGELLTPSLDCGLLPGVTREAVMEVARESSVQVREKKIAADTAQEADECFLTNAVRGVYPVSCLGARWLTAPGPVTQLILEAYRELVEREAA